MNGLDTDWLSAELAQVDTDIEGWSAGLQDSFASLFAAEAEEDQAPIVEPDPAA